MKFKKNKNIVIQSLLLLSFLFWFLGEPVLAASAEFHCGCGSACAMHNIAKTENQNGVSFSAQNYSKHKASKFHCDLAKEETQKRCKKHKQSNKHTEFIPSENPTNKTSNNLAVQTFVRTGNNQTEKNSNFIDINFIPPNAPQKLTVVLLI